MNLKVKSMLLGMVLVAGLSMVANAASEKMVWYAPWDYTLSTDAVINLDGVTFAQDPNVKTNSALARTFNLGGDAESITNEDGTAFVFEQNAAVAQWIKWTIDTTQKDWFIRQPGLYYSDGIKFTLASNGAVKASFLDFEDLKVQGTVPADTQQTIETFYSLDGSDVVGGAVAGKPEHWIAAADLENAVIPNNKALHYGQVYELWTALQVEPSNSAGQYSDQGMVMFELVNQQPFIATGTGLMNF